MWPTRIPWSGSSARQPLSASLDGSISSLASRSVRILSGILPPATSPTFCLLSATCEAWDTRLPLLAIWTAPFLPDPLRTENPPATQLRPKNRSQTPPTPHSVPPAPIPGRAARATAAYGPYGSSTRCENPAQACVDGQGALGYNGRPADTILPLKERNRHAPGATDPLECRRSGGTG